MTRYSKLKAKYKENLREQSYTSYLLTALSSMFKWTVPESVEPKYLEEYLHCSGSFAAQKKGDKYAVIDCPSRAEKLDQYGDGRCVYGVNLEYQVRGTLGEDVLICYNNIDRTPDLDIIRYADAFSEIDKAIMANVHWTILAPILCANDDKTASAINKLIDDMLAGKLKCITSKDVLESLRGASGNGAYSIDITHPERIKNVQYQSELYDVLMRRFFNKYGLNIQNTSKHAQASVDEVHGLDCVSWILPLDMLEQRKTFCKKATELWGDTFDVEFKDPWAFEYKKYKNNQTLEQNTSVETTEKGDNNEEEMV